MVTDCIHSIELTTNSNEVLSISSDDFQNLYISHIDDNGDEIPYQQKKSNILYANFFMVKILDSVSRSMCGCIERLYEKKDIVKLSLRFTNGLKQDFELAKKRILNNGILENKFEYVHLDNNNLCIIISDKKIKYKENLFQ